MSTLNMFLRVLVEDDDHNEFIEHDGLGTVHLEDSGGKPWRDVFLATFLINLTSLAGVILVAFSILGNRLGNGERRTSINFTRRLDRLLIPSFAAGALLSTSVFLIIPESIELIAGGHSDNHDAHLRRLLGDHQHDHDTHDDAGHSNESHEQHDDHGDNHSAVAWKFGVALMAGYLLPFLIACLFPHPHLPGDPCDECEEHESLMGQSRAVNSLLHQADEKPEPCCVESQKCATKKDRATTTTASVTTMDAANEIDVDEMIQKRKEVTEEGKNAEDPSPKHKEGFTLNEVTGWTAVSDDKRDLELDNEEEACCENLECVHNHDEATPSTYDYQLIGSILIGDGFHNFTDGLFVGNAFLFCDRSFAYAVALATIYHELAQEFSDFCLLTRHCGLSVVGALAVNFASGFSVMLGAFVILSVDLTTEAMGIILALSAGVYLYIAGAECIARIQDHPENRKLRNRLIFVLCFALGAVPIGLVLLNHSHGCE